MTPTERDTLTALVQEWRTKRRMATEQCTSVQYTEDYTEALADCAAQLEAALAAHTQGETTSEEAECWLIRDGHSGLWWRPKAMGYTGSLLEAGLFTEAYAKNCEGPAYADRNDKAVHISEFAELIQQNAPKLLSLISRTITVTQGAPR